MNHLTYPKVPRIADWIAEGIVRYAADNPDARVIACYDFEANALLVAAAQGGKILEWSIAAPRYRQQVKDTFRTIMLADRTIKKIDFFVPLGDGVLVPADPEQVLH